jgi:dUTP pyrophosphatase
MKIEFTLTERGRIVGAIPIRATSGSAGLDLYACDAEYINTECCYPQIKYHTGVCVKIPAGYVGLVVPRSSVSHKDLRLANSVGVIDSDYTGEITVVFDLAYMGQPQYKIKDRIAQLVIVPYLADVELKLVDMLDKTERGSGGYGSTGA